MKLHRALPLALLLCGAATTLPASAADQAANPAADPLAILAAAKQASGAARWDAIETLREAGSARQGGQDGSFDELVDMKRVRNVEHIAIGPTVMAGGWDGAAGWSAYGTGPVMPGTGKEAIADGIGTAYKAAYAFFWPERYPARFDDAGRKSLDGQELDVVRVTPARAQPFELWIDRRTHLIAREVDLGGATPSTSTFSDYRPVDGVLLPFSVRESNGDAALDTLYTVTRQAAGPALAPAAFAPPASPAEPDPFPAGRDSTTVPIQVIENLVLVPAAVNGGAPQTFMFDTGAIAVLDQGHAQAMGVQREGAVPGGGFGNGTVEFGTARVRSIAIGDAAFPGQGLMTLDLAGFIHGMGVDFAGFLGLEVAQRAVIRIDYEHETMTLTRPAAFRPPSKAIALPLKFNAHHPTVDALLDGMPGEFEIDTGADNALTLMAPFAREHGLDAKYARARRKTTTGLGGASGNLLTRTGTLQIGGATVARPVTMISTDERGVAASPWTAGNIGGDVLRRFTVTLDYPHRMLYLEPRTDRAVAASADFDRSGLDVERVADGSAAIDNVMPDSGAEQAGLRVGERILAIDGADVHAMSLPVLRGRLRGAAGSVVVLSVAGQDGKPREVGLTLRDLL
jgi:predicted aspartyl protease